MSENRPVYESEETLQKEKETAHKLSLRWKCHMIKLPMKSQVDFLMKRDGVPRGWIELKRRLNPRNKYPTYFISLHKWIAGMSMESATGLPFIIVVEWDNFLGYIKASDMPKPLDVNMGGRTDRDDAQDVEPMVHIPVHQFKEIVEVPCTTKD